jgi:hypothetical protein
LPGKYLELRGYVSDGKLPVNAMRILPKIELLLAEPMNDKRWNFTSTTTSIEDFTGTIMYGTERHEFLHATVELPALAHLAIATTPAGVRTELSARATTVRVNQENILPSLSTKYETKLYAIITVATALLIALIEFIGHRLAH